MAQAIRINRPVTLTASSNRRLSYPVAGVLEDAEFGVNGAILWATFRVGGTSCPVVVRHIQEA